jgi:NADH:ubiquinone oxidoreductase subunit 6 (subunit J)
MAVREAEPVSVWLVLSIVACALAAILARSLVGSALWLGATSALLATLLYLVGAVTVAVVELSVGTGLVAVLFVFAVGIAGEEGLHARPAVARPVALMLVVSVLVLLLGPALPAEAPTVPSDGPSVAEVLWRERAADTLGQVVLIVVGTLGVLTILGGRPGGVTGEAPRGARNVSADTAQPARRSEASTETGAREEATV